MTARRSALRVLVVYKKSSYEIYVRERRNTRVQELMEAGDPSVAHLRRAHEDHHGTVEAAKGILQRLGAKAVFRHRSGPVGGHEFDLMVTLGGDGTLLWASHLTGSDCPVVAINTAPKDSVGHFCAATRDALADVLADALAGRMPQTKLTRMSVKVDGEVASNRVLNDILFSHDCPAATTRMALELAGEQRVLKCSGLWAGPAAGSTAAMRSAGGQVMAIGSKRLQFMVREPYLGAGVDRKLTKGWVLPGETLEVTSHIRKGRLFVDGPHDGRIIDIGSKLSLSRSNEPLLILGYQRPTQSMVPPGSSQ